MGSLDRVPAPRSPLGDWLGRAVGLVALGMILAIVKPWGDGTTRPAWTPTPPAVPEVTGEEHGSPVRYDPAAYDPAPPPADWGLVTADGLVPLPFLGRGATAGGDGTGSTVDPVISGPVVPIGRSGPVLSIAVTHPSGASVLTTRLWSLRTADGPERLEVRTMPSPWSVPTAVILARPASGDRDAVVPIPPGLHRLDLLLGPDRVARSVMLSVGPDGAAGTTADADGARGRRGDALDPDSRGRSGAELDTAVGLLPDRATLWTAGRILAGWNRDPAPPDCSLADIWQATDARAPCWPVPLGETAALGVNLGSRAVARIELVRLDPLPGSVGTTSRTDVGGAAGIALVRAPGGRLPDGVYRLEARLAAGRTLAWYVEVGPLGRSVGRLQEASASR